MTKYANFKNATNSSLLAQLIDKSQCQGFDGKLSIKYDYVSPDSVITRLTIDHSFHQPAGIAHGGVLASLVEATASAAGSAWLSDNLMDKAFVGTNNATSFLKPCSNGTLLAIASPVHRGRKTQVWDVRITNEKDELISVGRLHGHNLEIR